MTLYTPIKEFDLQTQTTDITEEELSELLAQWGQLLSTNIQDADGNTAKLEHVKLNLSNKVSIVLPSLVLQNSFVTIEVENE